MKKLLLLTILLVNGCYLLSMEAEKEEFTQYYQELPNELKEMIVQPACTQDVISLLINYEIDQALMDYGKKEWKDVFFDIPKRIIILKHSLPKNKECENAWESTMKDPVKSKQIVDKIWNKFRNNLVVYFSAKTDEDKNYAKKIGLLLVETNKLIPINNKLLIALMVGAIGYIKNEFDESDVIPIINWYAHLNPKNLKTIEQLKQSFEKAFGHQMLPVYPLKEEENE